MKHPILCHFLEDIFPSVLHHSHYLAQRDSVSIEDEKFRRVQAFTPEYLQDRSCKVQVLHSPVRADLPPERATIVPRNPYNHNE